MSKDSISVQVPMPRALNKKARAVALATDRSLKQLVLDAVEHEVSHVSACIELGSNSDATRSE